MKPPALARALVERAVPTDAAGLSILGDLQQELDERAAAVGARRATWWYWRQALSIWWWSAVAHPFDSHHQPRGGLMFDLMTDVRHAVRASRQARGQTVLIVGTLGLAIGATTVGFSFADLAVLRGLPVVDADRAVYLFAVDPRTGNDRSYVALGDFVDYRARSETTDDLSAFVVDRATLIEHGQASVLDVGRVTADYFNVFGKAPALGRLFGAGDDQPGADPVVVLAHAYWSRVMGSNPTAIGSTLQIAGLNYTVIGVASPELEFGTLAFIDAWLPLAVERAGPRLNRRVRVMGRLKPGIAFETAAAEFRTIGDQLAAEHPETNAGWRARLAPIVEATGSSSFWVIVALLGLAVGLVLAIACANVANVLLVRATARRRDVAIRAALGASRFRIVRQLLIEGLLLSAASAALAVPVGQGLLQLIRSVDSQSGLQQLFFDVHELGFVSAVALAAPLLFALVPALHQARLDVRGELAAGGVRTGATRQRSRSVLVIVQIALAAVLLSVSGLAIRTAINVSRIDTGLVTDGALKFSIELDAQTYPDATDIGRRVTELRTDLEALPAVSAVGVFDRLPVVAGGSIVSLELDAARVRGDGSGPWALAGEVQSGSHAAVGIRLIDGRDFRREETAVAPVAIMGRQAALRYFGSTSAALGRRVTIVRGTDRSTREVVGVVTDVTSGDIELGPQPYIWTPLGDVRRVGFAVVGGRDAQSLAIAIRHTVHEALPLTPVEELETYDAALQRLLASDLVIIGVMAGFALLALVMSTVGLYGVVAYSAGQRRAEFGTRVALGATGRDVVTLVIGHAGRLLAIGLSLGVVAGLLAAQMMRTALVGVGPLDPLNVIMVAALLATVTAIASVVPALRAARVDLVRALRAE